MVGPAPHRWAKEDVASDVLELLDALELERALLVGHDWGGFVGYLLALREPERFSGYLVLNMTHPWLTPRTAARMPGARSPTCRWSLGRASRSSGGRASSST